MAEFQWWLLLLGLVLGGGIVAVVYMDGARREEDIDEAELPAEALLISERLAAAGRVVDRGTVERILREHREYRAAPPPDRLVEVEPPSEPPAASPSAGSERRPASEPLA